MTFSMDWTIATTGKSAPGSGQKMRTNRMRRRLAGPTHPVAVEEVTDGSACWKRTAAGVDRKYNAMSRSTKKNARRLRTEETADLCPVVLGQPGMGPALPSTPHPAVLTCTRENAIPTVDADGPNTKRVFPKSAAEGLGPLRNAS